MQVTYLQGISSHYASYNQTTFFGHKQNFPRHKIKWVAGCVLISYPIVRISQRYQCNHTTVAMTSLFYDTINVFFISSTLSLRSVTKQKLQPLWLLLCLSLSSPMTRAISCRVPSWVLPQCSARLTEPRLWVQWFLVATCSFTQVTQMVPLSLQLQVSVSLLFMYNAFIHWLQKHTQRAQLIFRRWINFQIQQQYFDAFSMFFLTSNKKSWNDAFWLTFKI